MLDKLFQYSFCLRRNLIIFIEVVLTALAISINFSHHCELVEPEQLLGNRISSVFAFLHFVVSLVTINRHPAT